jgi:hypothetical protein
MVTAVDDFVERAPVLLFLIVIDAVPSDEPVREQICPPFDALYVHAVPVGSAAVPPVAITSRLDE